MRKNAKWIAIFSLVLWLLAIAGIKIAASDDTFCVMQHTGYFCFGSGTLPIWEGTGGGPGDPKFALITISIVELTAFPGGVEASMPTCPAGDLDLTIKWVDMSDTERSRHLTGAGLWGNSMTVFAKWVVLSGKGMGFYTITFNACSGW